MLDVREDSRFHLAEVLQADNQNLVAYSTEAVIGLSPYGHGYCPLHYTPQCLAVVRRKRSCSLKAGILQDSCNLQRRVAIASAG